MKDGRAAWVVGHGGCRWLCVEGGLRGAANDDVEE